jgi:hypothetical protein
MKKYLLIFIILILTIYDLFSQLDWSTYLGGNDIDRLRGYKVDSIGNSFIYGITRSENFPTSTGAYLDDFCTSNDGFIYEGFLTKLKPDGTDIIFSTFIGPIFNNFTGWSLLDVDKSGNSYITGNAANGFPITKWISDTSFRDSEYNIFVTKVNSSGSALIYSTFIGHGTCSDIAVDASGNTFITGYSYDNFDFPTTAGVYDTVQWDIISRSRIHKSFVTKLNSMGTALIYSTLLYKFIYNGNVAFLTLDKEGNSYILSLALNSYPVTPGSYDNTYNGSYDLGVTKLNSNGTALIYSTYIGGSSEDQVDMIIIDNYENAYITGFTSSSNYPVIYGAYDNTNNGKRDMFVTKLNSKGNSLIFSTYIGGNNDDGGSGLAIDYNYNVYILGSTKSPNFPITSNAYYKTFINGSSTLSILDPSGSILLFSSYLNYSPGVECSVMDLNRNNYIYVSSGMVDNTFPITKYAYDTSYNGNGDINVAKYGLNTCFPLIKTIQYLEFFSNSCFTILLDTFFIRNTGQSILSIDFLDISGKDSSDFSIIYPINLTVQIQPGDSVKIIVQFNPYNIGGNKKAILIIQFNSCINPYIINLSGTLKAPIIQSDTIIKFPSIDCSSQRQDSVFIYNKGYCNLLLIKDSVSGPNYTQFQRLFPVNFPVTIAPGDSILYIINFFPNDTAGQKTAKISISNNATSTPWQINLSGESGSGGSPLIQAPNKISLPTVICKNSFLDYTFFVHNTGTCFLSLSGSTFTGAHKNEFSRISPASYPVYIKPYDSLKFIIRFMPDEILGFKTANLLLTSNASVNPYSIYLIGYKDSVAYSINNSEADSNIIDLGNICPGTDKDTIITILNESRTGTTFKIEHSDRNFQIKPVGKTNKKDAIPLNKAKKKKK